MSLNFDHALVALDQSEASDIITDCLAHFKKYGTQKFTLYTSVSIPYPGGIGSADEESYKKKLEKYKEKLEPHDFEVEAKVDIGINAYSPVQIMEAAKKAGADYIIIGNRGYNKFREFLLGSTATELLQRCPLPVYLINLSVSEESALEERKLYCVKSCRDSLQHILLPIDFSSTSLRAFDVVKSFSRKDTKQITLLHVQASGRPGVDDPDRLREFDEEDSAHLAKLKTDLESATQTSVNTIIKYGSPVKQILDIADEIDANMIIMGSQGRGYVSDLFLGGVSLQVIRKTKIPVLTVPADRTNEDGS
ncbi:MAG: universal stress protein [Balneolaceae bacterium]|nr:universal stress protein [Balneolaceae bacterium]